MGVFHNIQHFGGTSSQSIQREKIERTGLFNTSGVQTSAHGNNFIEKNREPLGHLANAYTRLTGTGWDADLIAAIKAIDENNPPNLQMAALVNAALEKTDITDTVKRIDNFHSISAQLAEEANTIVGATFAKGFSMPFDQHTGPTKELSTVELDVGVQAGMSKSLVLGFWKNRSDDLAGEGYFFSVSGSIGAGVGIVVYFDAAWNLQGFAIGPATGTGVEASAGWSISVHRTLSYAQGALVVAGRGLDFLKNMGKEVVTFADKVINGKKMSRALAPGEGYFSVFNQAGYVTKIQLWYKMAGIQKSISRNSTAGFTTEMYVPPGANDIRLLVSGVATIDKERLDLRYESVAGIKKAYKAFGTIFNVVFEEISPT